MIEEFIKWEKDKRCELSFFDGSGFAQSSSLPYAWSPIGKRVEIPGYSHSKRLNVLGFLSQQGSLFYQATTERVTSDIVIEAFEGFIEQKAPESFTIILLDNAPMHRSSKFKQVQADVLRVDEPASLHHLSIDLLSRAELNRVALEKDKV